MDLGQHFSHNLYYNADRDPFPGGMLRDYPFVIQDDNEMKNQGLFYLLISMYNTPHTERCRSG